MQIDKDRPSSETAETLTPPPGQNVKNLMTPGDDAAVEAEAETDIEPRVANPDAVRRRKKKTRRRDGAGSCLL